MELKEHKHQYINLIIKSVLSLYLVWFLALIGDFVVCRFKSSSDCEAQRNELRSAASVIPATLLAWLAESPMHLNP